jgi:hypothetical protein
MNRGMHLWYPDLSLHISRPQPTREFLRRYVSIATTPDLAKAHQRIVGRPAWRLIERQTSLNHDSEA